MDGGLLKPRWKMNVSMSQSFAVSIRMESGTLTGEGISPFKREYL
jgi:hypothetical protein